MCCCGEGIKRCHVVRICGEEAIKEDGFDDWIEPNGVLNEAWGRGGGGLMCNSGMKREERLGGDGVMRGAQYIRIVSERWGIEGRREMQEGRQINMWCGIWTYFPQGKPGHYIVCEDPSQVWVDYVLVLWMLGSKFVREIIALKWYVGWSGLRGEMRW